MTALDKLLKIAGAPIRTGGLEEKELDGALVELFARRNGFYAFEGALHVFSELGTGDELGVVAWNAPELWRKDYGDLADSAVFFAEDVFGGQFCLTSTGICTFNPETGERVRIAANFEDWADVLLNSYEMLTGQPLAHQWQKLNGPIPVGCRLVPKTPFVLGGDYVVENLHVLDAVKGMRFRADIARQIRSVPDGAPIRLVVE